MNTYTNAPERYRKKPMIVEAVTWNGTNLPEIVDFAGEDARLGPDGELYIRTLEGSMKASVGDKIIRGTRGEHYPCKGDIFADTYEAA